MKGESKLYPRLSTYLGVVWIKGVVRVEEFTPLGSRSAMRDEEGLVRVIRGGVDFSRNFLFLMV